MSRPLADQWRLKYEESTRLLENTSEVFTGFNCNIDVVHHADLEFETEGELVKKVESIEDLHMCLSYCARREENHEVDYTDFDIQGGEKHIGGQGGIISNFMARTGNEVILYTPYVSEELASLMEENILYPAFEDEQFILKSVRDSINSEKTKINHIFEFDTGKTGRLILSGKVKGYGPYLPKYLEDNLEMLQENVDCFIISGFHNAAGNREAKIAKVRKQISKIQKPVHLEYVHDPGSSRLVIEKLLPEVDSLGADEMEFKALCQEKSIEIPEEPNFGEAFEAARKLKQSLGLTRIHIHTYRYHIALASESYAASAEQMRDSMLYGELCAIESAEKGEIPESDDIKSFDMEKKHIEGVKGLADFGNFHDLEDFGAEGFTEIDGVKAAGIPVVIHEDPERTVGMGDIISSGAFSTEIALSQDS